MNCPLCIDRSLEPVFNNGIEIDVCPNCKGMWLDRGELAKLAGTPDRPASAVAADDLGKPDKSGKSEKGKGKKKRKKSLAERLGDVLEEVIDL